MLGFVEKVEGGRPVATDEPKDYPCTIEQDFIPTVEASAPFAYLVPARYPKVTDVLRAHGLRLEKLDEPIDLRMEAEEIGQLTRSRRVFEGHQTIDLTASVTRTGLHPVPAGTVVVRTRQALGPLAVYLLEPRSDDGLLTWNFFDDALEPGRDFPVLRIREAAPLKTSALD